MAKTTKAATDLMASASLVAILDGRGPTAKREVITYTDIFCDVNNFQPSIHIVLHNHLYTILYRNDLKVCSLLKQCQDKFVVYMYENNDMYIGVLMHCFNAHTHRSMINFHEMEFKSNR